LNDCFRKMNPAVSSLPAVQIKHAAYCSAHVSAEVETAHSVRRAQFSPCDLFYADNRNVGLS